MYNSVAFTLVVEFGLILLTVVLLLSPKGLFGTSPVKKKAVAAWSGFFFLFITFIWSVVVGIILAMNDLYLRW